MTEGHSMSAQVREAVRQDLPDIVKIHKRAFVGYFMTLLGDFFLKKYYNLILEYEKGILLVAQTPEKEILGFLAGFLEPRVFYKMMKKRRVRFALAVIPALIKRPAIIPRLLKNFRSVAGSSEKEGTARQCELSSIAVNPGAGGKGYGRSLLAAFLDRARFGQAQEVYLTTDALRNEEVNRFYLHSGFVLSEILAPIKNRPMNKYVFRLH
jgi:ribosomal protein S18 acetylase RimI-like enzyme